jgi:hypothetical protein
MLWWEKQTQVVLAMRMSEHIIEVAKSGRASCRTCKKTIDKGELRLGESVPSAFGDGGVTHQWHHLTCAADKKPAVLEEALAATSVEVTDKAALLARASEAKKKGGSKPGKFPYVERAPSARSTCLVCNEKLDKAALRVAIEREVDTGSFVQKGAGYLHPACAAKHESLVDVKDLLALLKLNSPQLTADDAKELSTSMGG